MELPHWRLASDDTRYVETEFVDAFLQVDEDHVRQHLKTIPASVYDYLAAVPYLT